MSHRERRMDHKDRQHRRDDEYDRKHSSRRSKYRDDSPDRRHDHHHREDAPQDRLLGKIEEETIISIVESILIATDHTLLIAAIITGAKRN